MSSFKSPDQEAGKCILSLLVGWRGNRRQWHEEVRGAGEHNDD